jgi:predicted DNA-binding transcriptional regulator AlpA
MGKLQRKVMTGAEVAAELGISQRSLERWVKRGQFPVPIKYGARRHWLRSVVDAWVAAAQKGGVR